MKNIHILSTSQSSRLYYHPAFNQLVLTNKTILRDVVSNQNIYITNDEEIKDGDWCLDPLDTLFKVHIYSDIYKNLKKCKKITLTTDQDLIKDGVQAIDNEFLEWFIRNPSCEEVDVIDCTKILLPEEGWYTFGYKIIIPQEETKPTVQEYEQQGLEKYLHELKQETVEQGIDFGKELSKWGYNKGNSIDVEILVNEILPDLFKQFNK
jgi:hypothetical protein